MAINIKLEEMLEAGAHLGHQARRWNPKMSQYIYGVKEGIHVFDLTKTRTALVEALARLQDVHSAGKVILFVGTKKQAKEKVEEIAKKFDHPYVVDRWLGGSLTNFEQMRKSVTKLTEMEEKRAAGEYGSFTKKERLLIDREIEKMRKIFGGVVSLEKHPDLVFIVDTHKESGAVKEARKLGIETMGVVDTNANPEDVTYPIPMNDDASGSLMYVLGLVEAALDGVKAKLVKKAEAQK